MTGLDEMSDLTASSADISDLGCELLLMEKNEFFFLKIFFCWLVGRILLPLLENFFPERRREGKEEEKKEEEEEEEELMQLLLLRFSLGFEREGRTASSMKLKKIFEKDFNLD